MSPKQANGMLVTFAFTRHPFNRLVSSYHNKMLPGKNGHENMGVSEDLIKLRSKLMFHYRNLNPNNSSELPTPVMFVTYLLDTVKEHCPLELDRHWRPQYCLCPFCSMDFDYIGEIQDMDTHVEYLSNLLEFPVIFEEQNI